MRILVTNDDGIRAPGLLALANVAREFGEVKVVAPDRERSACGHSMTMREPLRVTEFDVDGLEGYMVSGVPVDCVNVGLTVGWPDGCDLVLSGFNNGPNLGFDATYSGTVAGAMEGVINGIRSIAFSMSVFADGAPFHYETGATWLRENWAWLTALELPPLCLLNVNVPAIAEPELNGHRFVSMGKRVYEDRVERREDPWGRPYYWQGGIVVMRAEEDENDVWAVTNGYVAVTPITLDWTEYATLRKLRQSDPSAEPAASR
ncbi:MAG: 5'/3'-nucleotidase SurE [Fimbriimonadaceae bacterium]|nr:5'/3'-nucleotidase SurE [Fimbriimonadaceae bacterium]QYK54795.1 MAG: 5'/3'-nucleotidase SurE [Fimbriimonadaceae bacterium]